MTPDSWTRLLSSDEEFDGLFPVQVRDLSAMHWTPVEVAKKAAAYLGPGEDSMVLDVGAGAGKFCIAGSMCSAALFKGIEQKKNLVQTGNKIIKQLALPNATLLHGDFTDIDMRGYTGIYFYNAFHEQLLAGGAEQLFDEYTERFLAMLAGMPAGTRLATYWLSIAEIPGSYKLSEEWFEGKLKFWEKVG